MLYALVILLSILLICFVRKRLRPLSPASVFTLFWTGQILFMVIFFSGFLYFKYIGILYMLLCLYCFDLGFCAKLPNGLNEEREVTVNYNDDKAKHIYFFVLCLSFISFFYDIYNHGFGLQNLFDLNSFMEMSNEQSVERYSGDDEGGILAKVFGINTYACAILGGMSYYMFSGRKRLLSYLSLFPLVFGGLAAGAKMGIITGTFLWLIGLLIISQLNGERLQLNYKKVLFIILGVVIFIALLIIVMMFRIGAFDLDTMYVVFGKTTSYALGHLPAFDLWFSSHEDILSELTGGGKTFFGVTNTLGLLKRESGIFGDLVEVSVDGDHTNVFTIFRFLVEDFGKIGTLIYLFIMGIVCRIIYNHFTNKRFVYLSTTLMCGIYFFISWSFVSSIFAYATYIGLMFYLYFLLKFFFRIEWNSCPQSLDVFLSSN